MIVCFSGTGNTALVARELSRRLGDRVVTIDRGFFDNPVVDEVDSGRVIWMFPIYSWGVPPVVADVISRLQGVPAGTPAWMVATCGDDIGLAHLKWRRLVTDAGMSPRACFSLFMPNNYVAMKGFDVDSEAVARGKIEQTLGRLDHLAAAISAGGFPEDEVHPGSFAWIKTNVVYPWFVHSRMNPSGFHADDECNGCGKCARRCPLENIKMVDRRPAWSTTCAFCLRCYHLCPRHAIAWRGTTAGKGQYLGPASSGDDM